MGSHRVEIIFVCFRERRGIEQLLNCAHDGRIGPGVPLQVAWFAGQLGHIEGGRGLGDVELFTELPCLIKVFSCQCAIGTALFLFPICPYIFEMGLFSISHLS